MPQTWMKALKAYSYRVRLSEFADAQSFPGWFELDMHCGDREETIAFEDRFRENAPHHIEAWYEVVYWKMYSQGGRANHRTKKFVEQLWGCDTDPGTLWQVCKEYAAHPSRDALTYLKTALGFTSDRIAVVLTFPALAFPDTHPMVDSRVAEWTLDHWGTHNAADPSGPQLVRPRYLDTSITSLPISNWDFVASWVLWCRHMAGKLTDLRAGDIVWRARDVEMAVFTAQGGNLQLTALPPA